MAYFPASQGIVIHRNPFLKDSWEIVVDVAWDVKYYHLWYCVYYTGDIFASEGRRRAAGEMATMEGCRHEFFPYHGEYNLMGISKDEAIEFAEYWLKYFECPDDLIIKCVDEINSFKSKKTRQSN